MNINLDTVAWLVERLGLPLLLVFAFIKGWIVPAYVYNQLKDSEKEFRQITLRNTDLADRSVRAAELVVKQTGQQ